MEWSVAEATTHMDVPHECWHFKFLVAHRARCFIGRWLWCCWTKGSLEISCRGSLGVFYGQHQPNFHSKWRTAGNFARHTIGMAKGWVEVLTDCFEPYKILTDGRGCPHKYRTLANRFTEWLSQTEWRIVIKLKSRRGNMHANRLANEARHLQCQKNYFKGSSKTSLMSVDSGELQIIV